MKPAYAYQIFQFSDGQAVLAIVDKYTSDAPTMTVTNSIEQVLGEIAGFHGRLPTKIVYRDSGGAWDRVIIDENGEFVRFESIRRGILGESYKGVAEAVSAVLDS